MRLHCLVKGFCGGLRQLTSKGLWDRSRQFPGGLGIRTWYFHCRGLGSISGLGTEVPHQATAHRGQNQTKPKPKKTAPLPGPSCHSRSLWGSPLRGFTCLLWLWPTWTLSQQLCKVEYNHLDFLARKTEQNGGGVGVGVGGFAQSGPRQRGSLPPFPLSLYLTFHLLCGPVSLVKNKWRKDCAISSTYFYKMLETGSHGWGLCLPGVMGWLFSSLNQ